MGFAQNRHLMSAFRCSAASTTSLLLHAIGENSDPLPMPLCAKEEDETFRWIANEELREFSGWRTLQGQGSAGPNTTLLPYRVR